MNIEELRAYCLSLPHVTEDVKWEHDLCFSIGGKMFCVTAFEEPISLSLKAADDKFEALCAQPGIVPAPYLARYKWILIGEGHSLSDTEIKALITTSYELVKAKLPAKVKNSL